MINSILTISIFKIVVLWIVMYVLILLIERYQKKQKAKYDLNALKGDVYLTRNYLDQFYIFNKYYTFFIGFIYLFSIAGVFIVLRYYYLTHLLPFLRVESFFYILVLNILSISIIIITTILYKSLVTVLFKDELNKIYIYLFQTEILDVLNYKIVEFISGFFYLIFYRIGSLTYKLNLYPLTWTEDEEPLEYIMRNETDYLEILWNKKVEKILCKLLDVNRKYIILQILFMFIGLIFRFIHVHINKLYHAFPLFLLIMTLLYDFYNREIRYTFYVSFIYLVIQTKKNMLNYKENRKFGCDLTLQYYFYKNTIDYSKQRSSFMLNHKIQDTAENKSLFSNISEILEYTFDNFRNKRFTPYTDNKLLGIYRRFWIIVGCIIIGSYLYVNNNITYICNVPIIILVTPLICMLYCHLKVYPEIEFNLWYEAGKKEYKRSYNIIFWIFTIIQAYIFWIILFKPELTFMQSEILLQLPYDIIKVTKVYTIDEKVIYLYQFFEYYVTSDIDKDYLRHIIRQLNYELLLDHNTTLQKIQLYIKCLVESYIIAEEEYADIIRRIDQDIKNVLANIGVNETPGQWYNFIRNSIGILALASFCNYSYQFIHTWYDIIYNTGDVIYDIGIMLYKLWSKK